MHLLLYKVKNVHADIIRPNMEQSPKANKETQSDIRDNSSEPIHEQVAAAVMSPASNGSKVADRPHHLTLFLSLAAVIVSTLSFIQSLRTQKLTERLSLAEVRIQRA